VTGSGGIGILASNSKRRDSDAQVESTEILVVLRPTLVQASLLLLLVSSHS
jgi:hypothetical protein